MTGANVGLSRDIIYQRQHFCIRYSDRRHCWQRKPSYHANNTTIFMALSQVRRNGKNETDVTVASHIIIGSHDCRQTTVTVGSTLLATWRAVCTENFAKTA